jgi:hypothetical protein
MSFLFALLVSTIVTAKAEEPQTPVVDQEDLAERTHRIPVRKSLRKYNLPLSLVGGVSTSNYGFPGNIGTSNPWGFCFGARGGLQINKPLYSWGVDLGFRTAQMNVVGNNYDYVWLDAIEIGATGLYKDWIVRGGIAFNTSRVASLVFNSTISDKGLYGAVGYEISTDGPWVWSVEMDYTTIKYAGRNNPGLTGDASSNQFELLAIYTYRL